MTTPAGRPAPPPLRPPPLRARTVALAGGAVVLLAWLAVILVDGYDLGGTSERRSRYMWELLFNHYPAEWLQWFTLVALVVGAAYTAGRLTGTTLRRERTFWLLIAVGAGLMLVEDAANIRHILSGEAQALWGDQPLGIHVQVLVDLPYFVALAAVPVYAVVRHGPVVWAYRPVRPYLAMGFVLYGLAAAGNGVRHLGGDEYGAGTGDLYSSLGERLNRVLGIEPLPQRVDQENHLDVLHFFLIDGPVEESLELLGVAGLLAGLLAFVAAVSSPADEQAGASRERKPR